MIDDHRPLATRRIVFWLVVTAASFFLLWLLRGMLLPFVLGMGLAYVCDPLADRLERLHIPRTLATLMVLGIFVGVFVAALVLLLPMIQTQIIQMIEQAPHYADLLRRKVLPEVTQFVQRVSGSHDASDVRKAATSYAGTISGWVMRILSSVWSSGLIVANVLYVILLTPLVAFYFLRDWHRMVAQIDSWIPRRHVVTLRAVCHDIDAILAGFIRGQATVCFIFAIYYSLALSLAGLNFAIVIGIGAGILTFIPYLGAIAGLIISVVVAFGQFDDHTRIAIVAGVYLLGHLIEANLVTPNLVGDRVKLHPVWVIFALLAGGALFGFTGVLLAVPVAAVIGVLVRFGLARYLASTFYEDPVDPVPLFDISEL
jgi:predicted PurR-regulated permease PerM